MTDDPGRELLLAFPQPVLVVDAELRVLACSRRVLPLFGLRTRSLAADPREPLAQALAADQEFSDRLALALAAAQLGRPGEETSFGWRHRDRSYTVTLTAVAGEPEAYIAVFADTTASAIGEDIQLNARRYLEQVLDDIPVGVAVLNRELRLTLLNRQLLRFFERLGIAVTLVDGIGARLDQVLPENPGRAWHGLAEEVERQGERREAPRQAFTGEAGELVLATGLSPLRDQHGQGCGVILMCEDVTLQARLERELIRVEKLATVGQMVITVNHEINNPLSIISANAQTLRMLHRDLDERSRDKLLKIEEQVKRIAEVTERLRRMDEVATSAYISSGPEMIDVWAGQRQG
jgi:PAS domain-containing protein